MRRVKAALLLALVCGAPARAGTLWGVNISGLDMGHGDVAGTNFAIPNPGYYLAHGVQLVRIPFQIARLQPQPNGPLALDLVADLHKIIAQDHAAGALTVLDPHGYGFFNLGGVPRDILQDQDAADGYVAFMRELAQAFAGEDVAIGLMNEPHTGTDEDYAKIWNRAISAMRQAGYHGVILVPHAHWSAAADFNAAGYQGRIEDPDHNWILEVHSYLDPDGTGTYKQQVASAQIGVQRLAGVIAWSRKSHVRVFLGETGGPADPTALAALTDMFAQIGAAPDVFWGVAMWGGGAWWKPDYPMRLDPVNGAARPQFSVLENAMTPQILYLATDPGAAPVQVSVSLQGRVVAQAVVTASRLGAPQAVPLRFAFHPGAYGLVIQPRGTLYVLGAAWKGSADSPAQIQKLTAPGRLQISIPPG